MPARYFTADFETTTDINDCRVWSWAVFEVGSEDCFISGDSIESFIEFCSKPKKNYTLAFHNLKFDIQFIYSYLLNNGFEWVEDKKDAGDKTFTTLITDTGQFYATEVFFTKGKGKRTNKVKFVDSFKLINFSVAEIADSFGLPLKKGEIDYEKKREVGYTPTDDEMEYIRNDVEITARALHELRKKGATRITIGSNALQDFKDRTPHFRRIFPVLDSKCDADIRKAYKGGFSYVNPVSANTTCGAGWVFDVNSLYPSILKGCDGQSMPVGKPVYFEGKYQKDFLYPLYIQKIACKFKIKPGKIPSIQIKHTRSFMPNEYIENGNWDEDEPVILTLCSVDMELFFKQYDVKEIRYIDGWKMKERTGVFDNYINFWMKEKIVNKKKGLKAQTAIAKLYLNSLYGKMGTSPDTICKKPYLGDDGIVHYESYETPKKDTVYIPCAVYTTAYGRYKTITTSQAIRDWSVAKYGQDLYRYSDTDSIHMNYINKEEDFDDLKKVIDIDDYELGKWSLETEFVQAKWLRQKCYIEQDADGTIHSTIAGLPKELSHLINFENFRIGFTTADFTEEEIGKNSKKSYTYCKGGVVLTPTDFTIK